jgi:hypothetical protein
MRRLGSHSKESVVALYRLILDRDPESDQVVYEKRKGAPLSEVALAMLASEEFVGTNETLIRDALYL